MTLRDAGDWLDNFGNAFSRDVSLMFSENILDWPIWTVVIVAILGFAVLVLITALLNVFPEVVEKIKAYTGFIVLYLALSGATSIMLISIVEYITGQTIHFTGAPAEVLVFITSFVFWAIMFVVLNYFRKLGREQDG